MKAFVRYLAINARQPDAMADHYQKYFAMRELARAAEGGIALTDGWVKVELRSRWPANAIAGMSHYGLAVDDLGELRLRLRRYGPYPELQEDGAGEYFVLDPHGMPWAVSARDFGMPEAAPRPYGVPRIRHAELSVGDTQREMEWMTSIFGLEEVNTSKKLRQAGSSFAIRLMGDGVINVTFLPFDKVPGKRMSAEHREKKWVVQHFGWVVPDMMGLVATLPAHLVDLKPMTGNMAECQVYDPDENCMDLSQDKGFEVSPDLWERGHGPGGPPATLRMPPA